MTVVRKRAVLVGMVIGLLVVASLLVARRHAVLDALLPRMLSAATGYEITIGEHRLGTDHGALLHVHVAKNGEPVLDARRIDVWYSLRDLLPGSRHRYGVNAIAIDHPTLTIVRHKDGGYNIAFPHASDNAGPQAPQMPNRVPIAMTVRIRDGVGSLRAPYAIDPQSHAIGITHVALDSTIDTDSLTQYQLDGAFVESTLQPFRVRGKIDIDRGFAMHHATAGTVPLRAIANYFINSDAARILGGTANGLDLRLYALDVQRDRPVDYHVSGSLLVADGEMHIVGLAEPLRRITGRLQLVDDTFYSNNLRATLAAVPVFVSGGIYDFASPQYDLGIAADGELAQLRRTFAFSANQPLTGRAAVRAQIAGPLGNPSVLAHLDAPRARYAALPLRLVHAGIAYQSGVAYLIPVQAYTHGAYLAVRGTIEPGDVVHSHLAVHLAGNANQLPYAGEVLGDEPLVADAIASGTGLHFDGFGALASTRGIDRAAAVARFGADGVLSVAPLWLRYGGGTLAGAYGLDRATDHSGFWLRAHGMTLQRSTLETAFSELLPAIPAIDGTVDDLSIEGGGPTGTRTIVAGALRAHAASIAGVRFDTLGGDFAGTLADAAVANVDARGPWGSLAGAGALSSSALAVRGVYHGTLEGLRPYLQDPTATGHADGVAALAISPQRITVQLENVALRDARVRGLPIDRATGTLGVEGGALRVYSAQASVGGGDVVAGGRYDRGIDLVATHVDAARVRALGIPLDAGTIDAAGSVAAGSPLPRFDGGVSLRDGRVHQYRVAGTGSIGLAGDGARVDHVLGSLDGTYAQANGTVDALTSGDPRYDVRASIAAGDLRAALVTLQVPTLASTGTYAADLAVGGHGLEPVARGPLHVIAGSVNGLPYIDARAQIDASRSGVIARRGSVHVGTTFLAFAAGEKPSISGVLVRSPHTDLADFNNFFDLGDMLRGTGPVRFDAVSQAHRVSSNGSLAVRGLAVHDLPIGDTRANWSSARNLLKGSLAVEGPYGSARSNGSIAFAPSSKWLDVLRNSDYHVTLDAHDLTTSTWIAVAGFPQVPLTGALTAHATVSGRYPHLKLHGDASLDGGSIWHLPIEAADVAVSSLGSDRLRIDSGSLVAPGITATVSGSVPLRPADALDAQVYLNSQDLPRLIASLWSIELPLAGDFESTVNVGGTYAHPTFNGAFDASNAVAYGVKIPSIFGSVSWRGKTIELRNAAAQFERGEISLAGTLPLQLQPFGIGPPSSPVSFDLAVNALDPSTFETLLGHNTRLGGTIDGKLAIAGTVRTPRIYGRFGLKNGAYVSDLEQIPVTSAAATLTFDRSQARIDTLSARLGSGRLDASGQIAFPEGFASIANGAGGATFTVTATARDAQLAIPQLGSGALSGAIALQRATGERANLTGDVTLHDATIPFAAFLAAAQGGGSSASGAPALDLGFGLRLAAGKNVRVRGGGYGAGLDIGAVGSVALAGTLAAPTLAGQFNATSGTLTYFDRAFRVQDAVVAFSPDNGIIPNLRASGVTHISNADPNRTVNPYGSTDVTITLDGPINALKISFASNPPGYSNDQILAMIAPFSGLVNGVAASPGLNGNAQTVNGVPIQGALSPVPGGGALQGQSTTTTVGQEAFNIVNAQFTAGLLTPIENALSQGLGFQTIDLNLDYYGNVGITATRLLGKTVNFVYSQTFGIPERTSVGLETGNDALSAQLAFYWTSGPQRLFQTVNGVSTNSRLSIGQPVQGQSGFAFTLQRLYW